MPKLDLRGIDWVIVGGESGPGARAMDARWVTDLRDQCGRAPPRRTHLKRDAAG
jgi:protein gp37